MSHELPAPPVYSPCEKKWEFMHRAGLRRQFCDRCQLPVHNLSALSKPEAAAFLEASKTRRTCLTYVMSRDGTMVTRSTRDAWKWRGQRFVRGWVAVVRTYMLLRSLTRGTRGSGGSARLV